MLKFEHELGHAGHPGFNKMYTSMRRTFHWDTMVDDVYSVVSNGTIYAKGNVQGRRRTNPMRLFPATELFNDVRLDLLGPLLRRSTESSIFWSLWTGSRS